MSITHRPVKKIGADGEKTVPVESTARNFAVRTNKIGGIEYVGLADIGSANNGAVWQIQRLTTNGQDLTIEWADGNDSFDNVWDDRAALSYS